MLGGNLRGPVDLSRQRRTIRVVQILLVLVAGGLMMLSGYSLGRVAGFRTALRSDSFDRPRAPSAVQPAVLVILGGIAIAAAAALQEKGSVRLPTPARLDELAGRAEGAAIAKAEEIASD
jgi:hypothetical protein